MSHELLGRPRSAKFEEQEPKIAAKVELGQLPLSMCRTTTWYAQLVFGEIRWTDESEAHIARHNITPDEVQEAIYTRPRYRDAEGDLELIYGTTMAGRYLVVVVSEAIDGRDFIVTARDMTDTEKRLFREKGG